MVGSAGGVAGYVGSLSVSVFCLLKPTQSESLKSEIRADDEAYPANRFRKLGFIEYNGKMRIHNSLLNVILHDTTLAK
jgi:hypothetical protein